MAPGVTLAPGETLAPGAVAAVGQNCDPDTGICSVGIGDVAAQASAAVVPGAIMAGAAVPGAVMATTLDQSSGWGESIALILLVVVLLLGLVLGPAFAWRYFSDPSPA